MFSGLLKRSLRPLRSGLAQKLHLKLQPRLAVTFTARRGRPRIIPSLMRTYFSIFTLSYAGNGRSSRFSMKSAGEFVLIVAPSFHARPETLLRASPVARE